MMTEYSNIGNSKLKTNDLHQLYGNQKITIEQSHLNNYGYQDSMNGLSANSENYMANQYMSNHYSDIMLPTQAGYYNNGPIQTEFLNHHQQQQTIPYPHNGLQANNYNIENKQALVEGFCTTPITGNINSLNNRYFGHENQNNENQLSNHEAEKTLKKSLKSDEKLFKSSEKVKSKTSTKNSKGTKKADLQGFSKKKDSVSFQMNSGIKNILKIPTAKFRFN